jgi:serine phosphatase RsbU (regulator of sigma subunit)/pSer/pThr/pTyr-binding forkhead associated (FHA) protein
MSQYPELLVRPLHGEPFRFAIDKDVVSIGRSRQNDLVLADQWLSRKHAEIRRENGGCFIYDLDSRNGTLVNGVRIANKVPLHNGDVVTLGDQTLTFSDSTSGVILSETPGDLDLAGTVVVPTEQLLGAMRAQEDTWDNLQAKGKVEKAPRKPPTADDSARIVKQNQILLALSQASMALISDRPLQDLLDFILELAFKVVKAERGCLMLTRGGNGQLEVKAVRSHSDAKGRTDSGISFSKTIADKVIREKVSILTSNAMDDPRFRSQDSIVSVGIRSAMCVPLWNNQAVMGLLYVDSRIHASVFNEDDLTLLTSLANLAAVKIENAKLLDQMIEKKRMEHELALAGDIQRNLLPREAPGIETYDVAGTNQPCYTIGGDYFDFIRRPNGRLAFALGDVSGKGASAALMMAVLRATVHDAAHGDVDVVTTIGRTNRVMCQNTPPHAYVTFFLGDLDPATGELRYVNAGHIPPVLYRGRAGKVERLEEGGTVLGMFDNAGYEEGRIGLEPGDVLVVFTDGISEAWGPGGEEFGEQRVADVIRDNVKLEARDLIEAILREVDNYSEGDRPTDDRTLIVMKRL